MVEEKGKENLGEISERDLNKSVEYFDSGSVGLRVEKRDQQELYKEEERKIEQAIERSGEKLKQGVPTNTTTNDDNIVEIQSSAKEIAKMDAGEQINHLLKIAEIKNPYLALQIAKHLRDNYVLSELHSDLTEDRMRELFIKRGLL